MSIGQNGGVVKYSPSYANLEEIDLPRCGNGAEGTPRATEPCGEKHEGCGEHGKVLLTPLRPRPLPLLSSFTL